MFAEAFRWPPHVHGAQRIISTACEGLEQVQAQLHLAT